MKIFSFGAAVLGLLLLLVSVGHSAPSCCDPKSGAPAVQNRPVTSYTAASPGNTAAPVRMQKYPAPTAPVKWSAPQANYGAPARMPYQSPPVPVTTGYGSGRVIDPYGSGNGNNPCGCYGHAFRYNQ